jgi:hypothetical protein
VRGRASVSARPLPTLRGPVRENDIQGGELPRASSAPTSRTFQGSGARQAHAREPDRAGQRGRAAFDTNANSPLGLLPSDRALAGR